ncbi:hypothetical protein QVD99_000395 [Batrachochytrium dendrobatidis]|nr:hypothetical protein QVD99_000395 [Batrachochytrium dendrobatidis]
MVQSRPTSGGSSNYYLGDSSATSKPIFQKGKQVHRETPLIINALDIKKLTQKLDGNQVEEQLHQMLSRDREQRHHQSKARVANWGNTFAGQRRARIVARETRLQNEELARVKQDQMFRDEEIQKREAAIQRAKKMQYFETDMVKAFHSRVMLLQVLEERDMQIQLKNSRKNADLIENKRYHMEQLASIESQNQMSAKSQKDEKIRNIQLARDQLMQQREKIVMAQKNRKLALEEGQKCAHDDREYQQLQLELEKKRQENAVILNKQQHELQNQQKERKIREREESERESMRIEAWANRKANQVQLKKDLESKWHNDGINIRHRLGETQLKISNDADAKVEEQIKQRMVEHDLKAKKEERDKLEKKKKNYEELDVFFQNYMNEKTEQKKKQKEEGKHFLQEFIRVRDEANAQKETKRMVSLQNGKNLQNHHLRHIEQNAEQRAKDKNQRLAEAAAQRAMAATENQVLHEYMKQTKEEPWAVKNTRLQTFINNEISRPRSGSCRAVLSKKGSSTTNRLGFTNNGYNKLDIARTNEIVTGDLLKVVGEEL